MTIHADKWEHGVQVLSAFSKYGMYGVDIFFVLSGFIITSLLLDERERRYFYQNFHWKRILRILPLFALTLLLVMVFEPGAKKYVLLSVFFVVNYANVFHVSPYLGPFWTLAIEEQFYLLWPVISRKVPARRLRNLALGVFVLISVIRMLSSKTAHHNFPQSQYRFDGLALGAALACEIFMHRIQHLTGADGVTTRRLWWSRMRLFLFLPAVGLGIIGLTGKSTWLLGGAASESLIISSTVLATAAVIAYSVSQPASRRLALLRSRFLVFFGAMSYAFYLAHTYLLRIYDHFLGFMAPGDASALTVRASLVLVVTVLISLTARKLIEEPAHSLRSFVLQSSAVIQKPEACSQRARVTTEPGEQAI